MDKEHSDPPDANTRVHEVTADSDRLTSLPLHLRYTILSLLPLASAVQTSVFSKGWKHTWKHIRRLHFNENAPFYNRGRLAYIHYKIMEALKGHSLDEFVLHLRLPIIPVSSWIDEAIRKNIRTLDVNVDNIDFPDCFFVCGTLLNLKIRCLRFVRDNINHVHVDLPKLVSFDTSCHQESAYEDFSMCNQGDCFVYSNKSKFSQDYDYNQRPIPPHKQENIVIHNVEPFQVSYQYEDEEYIARLEMMLSKIDKSLSQHDLSDQQRIDCLSIKHETLLLKIQIEESLSLSFQLKEELMEINTTPSPSFVEESHVKQFVVDNDDGLKEEGIDLPNHRAKCLDLTIEITSNEAPLKEKPLCCPHDGSRIKIRKVVPDDPIRRRISHSKLYSKK
ncbi:hypothetical protein E3N88_04705 [Mikania micrantha]|uniref:F-box domain-containing protein n=1 Tax=Mikania micrantha TaxID=192012 RepID=A0A5N6PWK8_9ASTR|nr:hypothetical protein E3N88_04705 [Mikania micrantha]